MDSKTVYEVTVEQAGLNWETAGPLFDRYAVQLSGQIDRRWVDCYQRITVSEPSSSRFRLEPGLSRVTFTCRSTDGPPQVLMVLKRLAELLARVNREATAEAAAQPRQGPPAGRSTMAAPQAQAATTPASIAASLLSRFTRH